MDTGSDLCHGVIKRLWDKYSVNNDVSHIPHLNQKIVLDHIAIIDLGFGSSTRIELSKLFEYLGFEVKGHGYLPEKNNDFLWMCKKGSNESLPQDAYPQIVLGDFRIETLNSDVRNIVEKYGSYQAKFDFDNLRSLMSKNLVSEAVDAVFSYLESKSWPLITKEEYKLVEQENQLLAWVLMFGRTVNHFGLDIQFSTKYSNFSEFNQEIQNISNYEYGHVKGSKSVGIEQSSSLGKVTSSNGINVPVRGPFLEFVWRYPTKDNPVLWCDYYRGFLPNNANKIIESVYLFLT